MDVDTGEYKLFSSLYDGYVFGCVRSIVSHEAMTNGTYLEYVWESFDSLDIQYWRWVVWVVYPIILSFLLPALIALFLYGCALFLHVHSYLNRIQEAYHHDFWYGARKTMAAFWDGQARIWHGYEIEGLEKLPEKGPGLIVYYHGAIPIDFYYIITKVILERDRHIRAIGDNFLFSIPGWRILMEAMRVTPGTIQSCVKVLKEGHLLGISPGGVREALFGDEYYPILWGERCGFAKVAIQANVPIYPVFTQNLREAFRTPKIGRYWLRSLYEKTRLPIVPIYGYFPVKMKTYIGDPIYPVEGMHPEELALQTKGAIQKLINTHQRIPGNILKALVDRLGFDFSKPKVT